LGKEVRNYDGEGSLGYYTSCNCDVEAMEDIAPRALA
jgi:hypothetical protein